MIKEPEYEHCVNCDEHTSRAGWGEDSLYTDDGGPYCEQCYETLSLASTCMLEALKSVKRAIESQEWKDWEGQALTMAARRGFYPILVIKGSNLWIKSVLRLLKRRGNHD